ncbi:hypothetical protein E2605_06645 [Dysgonomonas capnocytophagoides]|uniref:Uncharacterized protein n=1 Tax=Dysgonomonas capnocytophagoides TaxID=45254 RepID=A0A4Y8L507_9BACT|nr:hypothetical protein [Dysgonomonas capnocytophagoides]TFD97341.1 hypothetical protein E2605_06645 [Dysgonomonas capnocytophagoides]
MKKFPTACLCGRLFNDTLEQVSILEKYSSLGEVEYLESEHLSTIKFKNGSYDYITIRTTPQKDRIESVRYTTYDKAEQQQMVKFIQENFSKRETIFDDKDFLYGIIGGYEIVISIDNWGFLNDLSFGLLFLEV